MDLNSKRTAAETSERSAVGRAADEAGGARSAPVCLNRARPGNVFVVPRDTDDLIGCAFTTLLLGLDLSGPSRRLPPSNMSGAMDVDTYIAQNYVYEKLPVGVRQVCKQLQPGKERGFARLSCDSHPHHRPHQTLGNSKKEWERRVVEYAFSHQLKWKHSIGAPCAAGVFSRPRPLCVCGFFSSNALFLRVYLSAKDSHELKKVLS